jgi:5-methylcytosine-specific restriction endonuclease McrBC regulatory subunit McrC
VFFRNCKNDLVEIINYCRPAFELVSNDIKEQELKNIKYNPFFKEYKNAIKTGGYILKRFAYNISSTSETLVKTPPFWIDMPILFELYVYQKLLKANNFDAKKIQFQFKTYGNHLDFLINDGDNSMIIDAKYKVHYQQGHIHQDIRQVSGYARLNAVREKLKVEDDSNINCLIIYPTLEKHETDFNLDKIVEGFNNDNNRIMAYHKVYKLGVTLPTINK